MEYVKVSLRNIKAKNTLFGSSSKEFVVWGIPPNKTEEQLLFTKAKSKKEAQNICKVLERKHGVKKSRVQILDLSTLPDFTKGIN